MKHWYNNGTSQTFAETCPEGYVAGRLKKKLTKKEQDNQDNINYFFCNFKAKELVDFYKVHSRAETLAAFNLKNEYVLIKILKLINYDFKSQKTSLLKGKHSSRSHDSYVLAGQKSAKTQKENWAHKSIEEKENWSRKMSISHKTEHFKEIKTVQNREKWFSKSKEQQKQINVKRSETMKQKIKSLTPDEFEAWISHKYKTYFYDNTYFDSFPELCFYMYNKLELNNNISRSKLKIPYYFNGEQHLYLPDFELDGTLIEIKGDHLLARMRIPGTVDAAKYACMIENQVKIITSKECEKYEKWFNDKGLTKENFYASRPILN